MEEGRKKEGRKEGRKKEEEGRGKRAPHIKKRVLQKSSRGFAQILQWI
jgi:hypothetical protein